MARLENLAALHTGAHGHCRTAVGAGTGVAVGPLEGLEVVGVDDEGAVADGAAEEVVAGVAHDQAQVVLAGKVDAGLDVRGLGGGDHVDTIVAEGAGVGGVGGGTAGVVGEVGPETIGRLFDTVSSLVWIRS